MSNHGPHVTLSSNPSSLGRSFLSQPKEARPTCIQSLRFLSTWSCFLRSAHPQNCTKLHATPRTPPKPRGPLDHGGPPKACARAVFFRRRRRPANTPPSLSPKSPCQHPTKPVATDFGPASSSPALVCDSQSSGGLFKHPL
jgi:hypothetical protein